MGSNREREQRMFGDVTDLGTQLSADAVSEEHINQEMLPSRLQNIIQHEICDGYNHGVATTFTDFDGENMLSSVGINPVACERVPSPEQISSITVCSDGDCCADTGPFDAAPTFRGSSLQYTSESASEDYIQQHHLDRGELSFLKYGGLVENNQNVHPMGFLSLLGEKLDRTPEASDNIFPGGIPNAAGLTCENLLQSQLQMPEPQQFKQSNHQPYVHFDEAYEGQSQCYSVEQDECFNETARQKTSNLPLLPSEQPDRVPHVASKSSVLIFGPTGTSILADSRNLVLHKILISYIIFMSMPVSTGGGQTAFVNYLHLMTCNEIVCNCDQYRILVSHFDHCRYSACDICGPVRRFFVTGKLNQGSRKSKMGLSRAFDDRDHNRTSSNINDDILPPFKRLKMENFSFDNGVSHAVSSSMNQHRSPEQPSHLQQGHEVLVSDNSDAVGMDKELISPVLNSDTVPVLPKELIEEILPLSECLKMGNPASFGNGVSHAVAPSMLQHCVPEQPPHLQQWHEALVTKEDEAKPESKGELIAPAADVSGMKLDVPNIFGASLTDFFTADQLNEHITSLRLWIDQSIPKNISGNSMAHLVGENSCQLCSIDKLVFAPAPKYCSFCGAHIKHNLFYYCGPDEMGTQHCFCTSCFRSSHKGKISLNGTSNFQGKAAQG
ncbi:hypothetical protein F0562_005250 [Nyssa sinensis]|uniref:histone acetyltransferase n=1 Tax=Nyssa sinensis TaxID=561372 RepID=A0A5J5AN87_9ASTE|nr:hypothetical protein F0562_005250 [Nyssa sinensis]